MTWPEWSRERLISLVCRRRRPALLIISLRNTRTSFIGFQKPQIASVACPISGTIAAGISSIQVRPEFMLQMQACCYQECRAQQNAKNPAGYRRAAKPQRQPIGAGAQWPQRATYPQSPFSGPACCCDVAYLSQAFSQPTGPGRLWISLGASSLVVSDRGNKSVINL